MTAIRDADGDAGHRLLGRWRNHLRRMGRRAMLLVPMLIGIFIGNRFHHGMNDLVFRRTVSGALIASGLALLIK